MTQIDVEKRLAEADDRLQSLANLMTILRDRAACQAEDKTLIHGFRFAAEQASEVSTALWAIVAAYGEEGK